MLARDGGPGIFGRDCNCLPKLISGLLVSAHLLVAESEARMHQSMSRVAIGEAAQRRDGIFVPVHSHVKVAESEEHDRMIGSELASHVQVT